MRILLASFIRIILGLGLLCFGAQNCRAEMQIPEAQAKKAALAKPAPAISDMAKQMKLSGRVEVEVHINETGAVESAVAVFGHPLLAAGAVSAVKKWKFNPFQEGGAPAKAYSILSFEFKQ